MGMPAPPPAPRAPRLAMLLLACCAALLCAWAAGPVRAQEMAITFDDLPAHGPLPEGVTRLDVVASILGTLASEHMPPVYGFVNGGRGTDEPLSPAVLRAWRDAGQPLGNHTWSHGDLGNETIRQFERDVRRNEPLLEGLMGAQDWHWLRYPYLHEGDTPAKRRAVRAWLAGRGYRIAQTSMDFEDYLWNAPYARCMARHDEAALQVLHDTYLATAALYYDVFREAARRAYGRDLKYVLLMHVGAFDARMLPELIALYRSKGVTFTSMPDALSDPAYRDDPDIGEPHGGTHLELVLESRHIAFPENDKPYARLAALCQ